VSYRIRVKGVTKEYKLATSPPLPRAARPLLRLLGVRHHAARGVDHKVALDDVSFSVTEGERVAIIGENGAGKSTLLHLLAGVAAPTSGSVEVNGRVHAALTIGLALREDLPGRENLYLDAEVQGRTRAETDTVIDRMIAFADLGDFIDQPVRTYSSGMKARLAFSSLVFVEPEILLIDEMLSVGDYWFSQKATHAVRELCSKGRIVMLVSHNLESMVSMCSRCLWLDGGRLVADGDPAEVTAAYRERVRQRDETEMAAKFSTLGQDWAVDGAIRIARVTVGSSGRPGPASVLRVGEDAWISVELNAEQSRGDYDLGLRIERLDGLRVTENRWSESGGVLSSLAGRVEVVAEMAPMILGPGLYRVQAELLNGGTTVATAGVVFKVVAERNLVGGQPALWVPIEVSCRPRVAAER
jgi:ABC-type polysaccharide/polyol phosphate transport system ATPase subunit